MATQKRVFEQTNPEQVYVISVSVCLGIFLFSILLATGCGETRTCNIPPAKNGPVVIALVHGEGIWDEGHTALLTILEEADREIFDSRLLSMDDIARHGVPEDVDVILVGGGWAHAQRESLGATGVRHLREFVLQGGGYLGICAGSYLAADDVIWEGIHIAYPLNLFDGFAIGPLDDIAPWPDSLVIPVHLESGDHSLQSGPDELQMLYFGGAFFEPRDPGGIDVLLRYPDGSIAGLAIETGFGRVVLSGVHPELGELPDTPYGNHARARIWLLDALFWAAGR